MSKGFRTVAFRTAAGLWIACAGAASCAIDFGSGPRPDPGGPGSDAGSGGSDAPLADGPMPLPTPSDFTDPSRWDFFDLSAVLVPSKSVGVGATAIDDEALYFFPENGAYLRRFLFTNDAVFNDTKSWDTAVLSKVFHASSAAACNNPQNKTTAIFVASSTDEGIQYRSTSTAIGKGFADATPSSVGQQLDAGAPAGWAGAACSGTSLYLAPSFGRATIMHDITATEPTAWSQSGPGGSFRGIAHISDKQLLLVPEATSFLGEIFSSTADWTAGELDLRKGVIAEPTTSAFDGAIYDGHFTYLAPASGQKVARIDATVGKKPYDPWTLGPAVSALGPSHGGVFDGRYVYFAPKSGTAIVRYDTSTTFADSSSYVAFDVASLASKPVAFGQLGGAAFDGKYVYFTPAGSSSVIARFRTSSTSMPAAFSGSFY